MKEGIGPEQPDALPSLYVLFIGRRRKSLRLHVVSTLRPVSPNFLTPTSSKVGRPAWVVARAGRG
jgi:hypothetical protein